MSNVGGLVAVVVLGASTVFLTAAGTAARTQPADTCVSTGTSRTFRAQGVEGGSAVQVDTAKSARGEITAYLFGSLDPVRSTDGRRHAVSGGVSLQVRGRAPSAPQPFTVHALPGDDVTDYGDPFHLELEGSRWVGVRVRAIVHLYGRQYPSGWATVGRGEPTCEP